MKTLFASAALVAAFPAVAGTVSIGNSLARDCYEAAVGRDHDRNAFNHCEMALRLESLSDEDRAATLNNRGVLYLRSRNYRAAERDFNAAVALYDRNAEAWLNKAISALRNGAGIETVPMIEKAMALDTERPALAYYSRSIAYERAGRLRAAYNDLLKARELAPRWSAPREDLTRYAVRR
jgi:tetratricopeptide (TPR) repeat protein